MKRFLLPLMLAGTMAIVAACDGSTGKDNPHRPDPTTTGGGGGGGTTTPPTTGRTMPPGTENPSANSSIIRYEPVNGAEGSGIAESYAYNPTDDTFSVDNLPFDGDNVYQRMDLTGTALENSLGPMTPFRVYENENFVNDPVNGLVATQFQHKAIHAVSASGQSEFAIVRTGAYADYGFGGFMYTRHGRVTLPASGFARYTGGYAGLRDFNGTDGIEFVTGTADLTIDFNDFNDGYAVDGQIYNRRIFDANGNDITASVVSALESEYGVPFGQLPVIQFDISNALDENGEMLGSVASRFVNSEGVVATLESGDFYGIVSGDNADEVVGIIVVTSEDPRGIGVTVRETGGFIVTR
ncbi:hypothetical protein PGB28_02885 [Primorskyibacter aestuariivivens]|uniref:hypothetical protein n=1 Tax=Primorskyibacter aestuariivivens TaxID=1888912 RepID=UPI00230144E6|nr:hypothetical protein [Primorskyibacter aestuariivivens]MDA7427390.1 hypothetical protein [Primorskyibacter aestuariivivens]